MISGISRQGQNTCVVFKLVSTYFQAQANAEQTLWFRIVKAHQKVSHIYAHLN